MSSLLNSHLLCKFHSEMWMDARFSQKQKLEKLESEKKTCWSFVCRWYGKPMHDTLSIVVEEEE